ncbi:MAG: polysaccharide biosynthesis/export family protein [Gemmataceae bacterium]
MEASHKPALRKSPTCPTFLSALVALLLCSLGCRSINQRLKEDSAVLARKPPAAGLTSDQYLVQYPDVIEVTLEGPSPGTWRFPVELDGRIACGPSQGVRVEGQTVERIARGLEACLRLSAGGVHVRVVEYKSQHIYLYGQINGLNRPVPYEGPETVVSLLRRVGGITSGAADGDIHVIRSHVSDGKAPELFHVKLGAILKGHDQSSDVILQPFDQIYVGQSRKSLLQNSIPPLLRPVYQAIFGLNEPEAITR